MTVNDLTSYLGRGLYCSVRPVLGITPSTGALWQEVVLQFLVEAIVFSSFGGVIGLIVAIVCSLVLSNLLHVQFALDPSLMIIVLLFSGLVGVAFLVVLQTGR